MNGQEKEALTHDTALAKIGLIKSECKKFLIGIDKAIDNALLGMFSSVPYSQGKRKALGQAPVLLMAPPGYGKTDLARLMASAIKADFSFIAGHPEMRASEIMGGDI